MIAEFSAELVLDNFIKRTKRMIDDQAAAPKKTDMDKGQILGMRDALAVLDEEIDKERERVKRY